MTNTIYKFERNMLHDEHLAVSKREYHTCFKKHWHNYYEIIFYENCTGFCILNGEKFPITENCLFLLTPKDFHEIKTEDKPDSYSVIISFSEQIVDKKLLDTLTASPIVLYEIQDLLFTQIEELFKIYKKDSPYRELHLKHIFNDILIRIIEKGQPIANISSDIHLVIRDSIAYMLTHPTENITLETLSERYGISKTYFSHLFHDNTGVSFKQYLLTLRIEYAKRMLEDNELSIIDVAFECGFHTPSQFNRTFKKMTGMTPSEYRARKGTASRHSQQFSNPI